MTLPRAPLDRFFQTLIEDRSFILVTFGWVNLRGNMKNLLLVSSLLLSTTAFAFEPVNKPQIRFTVEEVSSEVILKNKKSLNLTEDTPTPTPAPAPTFGERIETTGKVISTAKDMVALGEAIYTLVTKGRPKNTTTYAPISVVPKDPTTKEHVDLFDLEGFSIPVEKTYVAKVYSGGKVVVNFTYKVMYSYGGSYNGTGKYLSNVIIIPGSVKTSFGWEFNAKMQLSGMMNHGTKANPVAGIMVTINYKMDSWSSSFERNDTVHITGNGQIRSYMAK